MNAIASCAETPQVSPPVKPSPADFDVHLPLWLKNCLNGTKNKLSAEADCLICRSFRFAYTLHEGQTRRSGEPYIIHPIAVASLLRDLGGDETIIAAGFLHDVVEDTEVKIEEIEALFGVGVARLVAGVTKLSKLNFKSKTEHQAENFRRLFVAMVKDIRVIVVKLADRLHNMRTLEALDAEKQKRIAQETREIFAPLANRLGMWRFKWELEDLAFKYLEPEDYRHIQSLVAEKRRARESRLEHIKRILHQRLLEAEISEHELQARPKHLYGIYYKMVSQQKGFEEIYDIAALRIIVNTKDDCYRALAIIHDAFKPIPNRFKDYIGLPKPNQYQSLHTTVVGLNGRPLEIQIRTQEMHRIAEYGIAAHWKYKESGNSEAKTLSAGDETFTWLRRLVDWQTDLQDDQEYVEQLRESLFDDDVYVFTPEGDVMDLAQGATPIDFAYRIHSEVGHHMKGVRINGQWSAVGTPLQNGDIVEIVTQKNAHPSLDWLNHAVTPSARHRIRQWFKRSRRDENILRGRELLEKELGKNGLENSLKSAQMQMVAERCNYQGVDDLLAGLGHGEITLNLVVNRWREITFKSQQTETAEEVVTLSHAPVSHEPLVKVPHRAGASPITGIEGLVYHIAGCCHPLPGELILGVVTRGAKGISIHRQGCPNVENVEGDRLIPVSWNLNATDVYTYPVDIAIEVIDRVGVLMNIVARLSGEKINIREARVKTTLGKPALISLRLDIRHLNQLDSILAKLRGMGDVLGLRRVNSLD